LSKKRDNSIFWGVIGVIMLVEALTVLGKAAGYWEVNFPFWATIFVWIGFAIVYTAVRKLSSPKYRQPTVRFWRKKYAIRWFERWSIWNNKFRELLDEEIKRSENAEPCC